MKAFKIFLGIAAVVVLSSACHRVKCPTDTFSKVEIQEQNQPISEEVSL